MVSSHLLSSYPLLNTTYPVINSVEYLKISWVKLRTFKRVAVETGNNAKAKEAANMAMVRFREAYKTIAQEIKKHAHDIQPFYYPFSGMMYAFFIVEEQVQRIFRYFPEDHLFQKQWVQYRSDIALFRYQNNIQELQTKTQEFFSVLIEKLAQVEKDDKIIKKAEELMSHLVIGNDVLDIDLGILCQGAPANPKTEFQISVEHLSHAFFMAVKRLREGSPWVLEEIEKQFLRLM